MSQEFHVIRCFNCSTFQVHQVKKSKKWNCKLCGEKQSIVKVYAQGSGAYCRHNVQQLNMIKGGLDTAKDELVQCLHAAPLLSTSKHHGCYNEIESYSDGKNQHSRWTHYTERSEDEEAHCPDDEDSSDVIYTTDRMLLPRPPGKRKKKVQSSGYTDDDLDQGLKKKYVHRSIKNGTTSETMKLKPFTNFKNGSCCLYENPKSMVVETFGEANVQHLSSAIRSEVLDGENYAESFGSNKYQQNILKRNTFVEKKISSEITVNNKNIGASKNNIPVGLDPCLKSSPFNEIDGSKPFSKFQRHTQFNNEFESKDQSCRLRTGNNFPSAINPSEKTTGSQPVMTCKTENLSKSTNQSKWSKFTEEYIDDENNDRCGETSSQEQSERYGQLQFNSSEEERESSVLTNNAGLRRKYTVGNQENSNKNARCHINLDYGDGINFRNRSDVSIHHGKQNMLMSSKTIFNNCSKQSELHTRSHVHKDARGFEISMKEKVPKSKLHWLTVGDISDDEFEL